MTYPIYGQVISPQGGRATAVSTNYLQACSLINNGSVNSWGFCSDGELGNSASADSPTAVNVTG
jgi:hypothetical protein